MIERLVALLGGRGAKRLKTLWLSSLEGAATAEVVLAVASSCPALEELDLSGTNLCVTGLGLHTTDALEIVARFVRASGALRKLNLQGTHLCGSTHDPANGYTLAGLTLLCDALAHPRCVVEELDLSECGGPKSGSPVLSKACRQALL